MREVLHRDTVVCQTYKSVGGAGPELQPVDRRVFVYSFVGSFTPDYAHRIIIYLLWVILGDRRAQIVVVDKVPWLAHGVHGPPVVNVCRVQHMLQISGPAVLESGAMPRACG